MEESTPQFSSWSKSALVLSPVALLVKGGQYGELVLPSLPPPVRRRREEKAELVCGKVTALTRRQNKPPEAVQVSSEEVEEQGGGRGRAWQHSLPFKVEGSIYFEPHLADSQLEPKKVVIQETGQTRTC